MTIGESYISGLRKVGRSPSLVFWIYGASLTLALPLAFAMGGVLAGSIGGSLVHESLRQGFDMDWYGEFSAHASGLAETFGPEVAGIFPVVSNLQRLADGEILGLGGVVLLAGISFMLAWAFLGGGILGRYARAGDNPDRRVFFGDSAVYFFRFVRLTAISLLLYAGLFRWVGDPLHALVERATRDVTAERTAMTYTLLVYAIVAAGIGLISLIGDYAKIAMVAEERSSAVLAFIRAARFVFSGRAPAIGLYLALALTGLALFALYWIVAPGPGQQGVFGLSVAFLVGQAYLICRIVLKLWFLAGQTLMFQSVNFGTELVTDQHSKTRIPADLTDSRWEECRARPVTKPMSACLRVNPRPGDSEPQGIS